MLVLLTEICSKKDDFCPHIVVVFMLIYMYMYIVHVCLAKCVQGCLDREGRGLVHVIVYTASVNGEILTWRTVSFLVVSI